MKKIVKYLIFYCVMLLVGIALFAISFRTPLFKEIDVYYYRGLSLIVTVGVLVASILVIIKYKLKIIPIDFKDIIVSLVVVISFNTVFLSVVTVSMDRSISVFMLADMATNHEKVYSKEEIEQRFMDIYMDEYKAMERRYEEQIYTGTIEEIDGGYKITDKGERLIKLFRGIAKIFPVDDKFLYPQTVLEE